MKHNAFLEKLLQGTKVEWKTLGEVANVKIGEFVHQNLQNPESPYLVYNGGTSYTGFYNQFNRTANKIIISARGANAGFVNRVFTNFWSGNSCYTLEILDENFIDWSFLYFYLKSKEHIFTETQQKGGIPAVSKKQVAEFQIPIPPLSVQQEIVKILDTLTALTSELTSELTLRQKQYQYYRDKLLTFGDEVEWKTLGEICEKIYSGGTPKTNIPEYWENGSIPWMSSGEVNLETIYQTEKFITQLGLDNSSAKFVPKNSIVIALAGQGKTRGKVARTRIDLTTNQSLASLTFNEEKINHDFVYHFLLTQYENLRQISSGSGTRGGLNLQMISNYKIPVPSLEEQKRIASILDKFHTLTSSLSDGLPKEIELRQKQYEYYREILLRFDK